MLIIVSKDIFTLPNEDTFCLKKSSFWCNQTATTTTITKHHLTTTGRMNRQEATKNLYI
jgi:hypothetical protein